MCSMTKEFLLGVLASSHAHQNEIGMSSVAVANDTVNNFQFPFHAHINSSILGDINRRNVTIELEPFSIKVAAFSFWLLSRR